MCTVALGRDCQRAREGAPSGERCGKLGRRGQPAVITAMVIVDLVIVVVVVRARALHGDRFHACERDAGAQRQLRHYVRHRRPAVCAQAIGCNNVIFSRGSLKRMNGLGCAQHTFHRLSGRVRAVNGRHDGCARAVVRVLGPTRVRVRDAGRGEVVHWRLGPLSALSRVGCGV